MQHISKCEENLIMCRHRTNNEKKSQVRRRLETLVVQQKITSCFNPTVASSQASIPGSPQASTPGSIHSFTAKEFEANVPQPQTINPSPSKPILIIITGSMSSSFICEYNKMYWYNIWFLLFYLIIQGPYLYAFYIWIFLFMISLVHLCTFTGILSGFYKKKKWKLSVCCVLWPCSLVVIYPIRC